MRCQFEGLECRDLMVANINIDGPSFVRENEVVEYSIEVRLANGEPSPASVHSLGIHLNDAVWTFNGEPISANESSSFFELSESGTRGVTGRVPDDRTHFVLTIAASQSRSYYAEQLVLVLDEVTDANTVGFDIPWTTAGLSLHHWIPFHSLDNAGDTNADGVTDLVLRHAYVNEEFESVAERLAEHILLGPRFRVPDNPSDVVLDPPEPPSYIDIGLDRGEYPIGDVDGDGFDDVLRTDPRMFEGVGIGTIFFGPEFIENFVIVGHAEASQIDNFNAFGGYAGPLGDINGDGLGDFYVASYAAHVIDVDLLYGRDFGRAKLEDVALLPGDIDGDGMVAFSDFTILSANYGRNNVAFDEGDLDGDGRVSITDFLILSKNYGVGNSPRQ